VSFYVQTWINLMYFSYAEFNLMDHKPSVVAAAATLVAFDQKLTIEDVRLKMNSIYQHPLLQPVSLCINFFFAKFHQNHA